jgi:membrane-associated protease RseP (regulator of RpoE activity)
MSTTCWRNGLIAGCLLAFVLQVNGFALPAAANGWDEEKEIIIVKDNDDDGVWLGVQIDDLTSKLRREMDANTRRGVVIIDVVEDSPAERAGLQKDDIIIKFNNRKILRATDLTRAIRKHEVGDKVTVEIERDQEVLELNVELGERSGEWVHKLKIPELHKLENFDVEVFSTGAGLGLQFQEMDADLAEYFGADPEQGLLVTKVKEDGPAEKAGVKSGDILLSIDGKEINEPDDVKDILKEYDEGDIVEVEILRKEETQTLEVELEKGFDTTLKYWGPYNEHRNLYLGDYKKSMDFYKEALERYKTDMKRRQDEYQDELKERVQKEIERHIEQQQLQIEKLQDEIERLQEQILELEKKVM